MNDWFHCANIVYQNIDDCVISVYNNVVRRNTNETKEFETVERHKEIPERLAQAILRRRGLK